jgi:hypothetical protein
MKNFVTTLALVLVGSFAIAAQDVKFDGSQVSETAAKPGGFAPKGWKVENAVTGDLNGDGKADYAITFVQDKAVKPDEAFDSRRGLVIAFADSSGLRRAAVAENLLQCTTCGGAFYGVMPAPAEVTIEKGVLVVTQEHGSRDVTETTYRFRFDEQPSMFILIGFDYVDRDRANGDMTSESTNYITGKRVTIKGRGKRDTTKTTHVQKMRYSIAEIDGEDFEGKATHRLGLD